MFTAENMKSTFAATDSASSPSATTMCLAYSGIGVSIFQRLPTASSYVLPALCAEAASVTTSNHGWFSSNVMKRWPTIPVAPRMPTFIFSDMMTSMTFGFRWADTFKRPSCNGRKYTVIVRNMQNNSGRLPIWWLGGIPHGVPRAAQPDNPLHNWQSD